MGATSVVDQPCMLTNMEFFSLPSNTGVTVGGVGTAYNTRVTCPDYLLLPPGKPFKRYINVQRWLKRNEPAYANWLSCEATGTTSLPVYPTTTMFSTLSVNYSNIAAGTDMGTFHIIYYVKFKDYVMGP